MEDKKLSKLKQNKLLNKLKKCFTNPFLIKIIKE